MEPDDRVESLTNMKISVHRHRPFRSQSNQANATAPSSSGAGTGSAANLPTSTPQTINLGVLKLKIHRPPSAMEVALRARIEKIQSKHEPRISKSGDPTVDLNCRVSVTPHDSSQSNELKEVECRHFSIVFAQEPGKKSRLMSAFSSRAGIKRFFDKRWSDTDQEYYRVIREAPQGCKHVVQSDQLGQYLTALAVALNEAPDGPDRPRHANCLLLSSDHAMALHLERKQKDGVIYFAAKLYDPNDTSCYKRVERLSPEDLGHLTLKDMMIKPESISD